MTTSPGPPDGPSGTPEPSTVGARLRSLSPRQWLAIALVVLAVLFILQNRDDAEVSLLFATWTAPMWITLLISTAIGVVIGLLSQGRRR